MNIEKIDHILKEHEYNHSAIISIMQDVQGIENYLPEDTLRYISEKLELKLTRIFDIATFYKTFTFVTIGNDIFYITIRVCSGTACHLGGAVKNLEQIQRTINIQEGETTDDRMFSLETVNCLGACALAPVMVIDEDYYDAVNPGDIKKILSSYHSEPER